MGAKSKGLQSGPGRPKNPPKARKLLKEIIPVKDIFTEEEETIYNSLVDIYIKDFDEDELTSSDVDDIMTVAMNKVLEIRLLKTSKADPDRQMDISQSIERIRKQTEKIKDNLSARRKDRVDPNKYKGFSIVDLAVAFDDAKKFKMEKKARQLKKEQTEVLKDLKKYPGNRYDIDGDIKKEDDY